MQLENAPSRTIKELATMTEEELEDLAIQFCTEDMYHTERRLLFREMDVDGSGKIGYRHFRAGMDKLMKQTGQCPLSARRFRRLLRLFDRDHSGSINENEFHQFLVQEEYDWPDDIINKHLSSENLKLRENLSQLCSRLSPINFSSSPERQKSFPVGFGAAAGKLIKKSKDKK